MFNLGKDISMTLKSHEDEQNFGIKMRTTKGCVQNHTCALSKY